MTTHHEASQEASQKARGGGAHAAAPERFALRAAYRSHFSNPRRERAFLHAVGFTAGFAGCRVVTHAIRAQRGPFRNLSAGGRHLHHSTPGIIGQIVLGYLWTWQIAVGVDPKHRAGSRAAALTAGLATALTLDEFALWFDLADDYWDTAGRKSIDAVVLFWGISAVGLTGRGLLTECGRALRNVERQPAPHPSNHSSTELRSQRTAIGGRSLAQGRAASIWPASE